jgi:hypothetical protein
MFLRGERVCGDKRGDQQTGRGLSLANCFHYAFEVQSENEESKQQPMSYSAYRHCSGSQGVSLVLFILFFSQCAFAQSHAAEGYILENTDLKVLMAKEKPLIRAYQLKDGDRVLSGDIRGNGPGISFYQGGDQVVSNWTQVNYSSSQSSDNRSITYHAEVIYGSKRALEFNLVYTLTDNGLDIAFERVIEHDNFYLIHILLPELITVKAADAVAKLAIPADAGRLIDVKSTGLKDFEYEIDWLHPILSGFAYNDAVIGIIDTKSIENHTLVSVFEHEGSRYGTFSMKLMHRLMEYDLEEFGPIVPVTDPEKLLKVQDVCTVNISITGDHDRDGKVSWVDGTKVLREKVDAVPNPYYKDKSFVRTFVDRPPTRRDTTGRLEELKFDEVLERIKEFAAQTDSAAYVMYLLGWQYEGHDSGYPSVDKVNENLGGYEALVNLIEEAKKYNVNVTFYDNYDDSYPNHPGWDPDVICRDPQGSLMKGGVWEGNQSYLISSYKYAMKSGLDRVRFTLETYPVQGAYFIDVLSGGFNGGRKYDFNPESLAGAQKNFEGKLMIIEAFNKKGLDIATEDFTGYFVGHVGTFGNIIAFDNVYFENEESIPLIPFVYHSKTSYGMKISNRAQNLKRFIYGQRAEKFTNRRSVFTPDDYLLDNLPKQKLYGKAMKSYEKEGDVERVVYEDGSVVVVNIKADTYSVALAEGVVIAKDYTSFVPMNQNVTMACSRDGGLFTYRIPQSWANRKDIRVVKLNRDGSRESIRLKLKNGNITFQSEANAPYKIMYGKDKI